MWEVQTDAVYIHPVHVQKEMAEKDRELMELRFSAQKEPLKERAKIADLEKDIETQIAESEHLRVCWCCLLWLAPQL